LLVALAVLGCGGESDSPPHVVPVLGPGSERATGFAVAPGRVVTVAHAVPDGAAVLSLDRRTDLALIAVPGVAGSGVETAAVKGGDSVRVLLLRGGRVDARSAVVRRAIEAHLTAPGSPAVSRPALELDVRLRAGDSGAPVLTDNGELAGVLFARSRNRAQTAYAVDAKAVDELLDAAPR
jgi:S1-C subfamily serine protease